MEVRDTQGKYSAQWEKKTFFSGPIIGGKSRNSTLFPTHCPHANVEKDPVHFPGHITQTIKSVMLLPIAHKHSLKMRGAEKLYSLYYKSHYADN